MNDYFSGIPSTPDLFSETSSVSGIFSEASSASDTYSDISSASEGEGRRLRILVLHGFTQNADIMRLKTEKLHKLLTARFEDEYPSGVDMIYRNGPVTLSDEQSPFNWRAWWKTLDDTSHYDELAGSLEDLLSDLDKNPVDGVIGFSQGATMAVMLASLCEGTLGRIRALATQGAPFHYQPMRQQPFRFVIAVSGWRATPKFYRGFYRPKITTPILHVIAELDHLISPQDSMSLIKTCRFAEVLSHQGGHWIPAHLPSMNVMADFVYRKVGGHQSGRDTSPDVWEDCKNAKRYDWHD